MISKFLVFVFLSQVSFCFSGGPLTPNLPTSWIPTIFETIFGITNCLQLQEAIDPVLGHLPMDADTYCTQSNLRNMAPGITCCPPQTTEQIGLVMYLFNPDEGENYITINDYTDKSIKNYFKKEKDVVILIGGWTQTILNSSWRNLTRKSYNDRGHTVIIVDYPKGNTWHYFQTAANLRTLGSAIGHAIINWDIADKVLLVGYSLGGQTIGEVAKYVKQKTSTGKLIKECHALDPAGPFFDGGSMDTILDKDDCQVVQVIHTSANIEQTTSMVTFLIGQLGTYRKSGHCDFWLNCGHFQGPDCKDFSLGEIFLALKYGKQETDLLSLAAFCSHSRSTSVYESALSNKCDYQSYFCPNCGPRSLFCHKEGSVINSLPPMSKCDSSMDVNYVLFTESKGNFCNAMN